MRGRERSSSAAVRTATLLPTAALLLTLASAVLAPQPLFGQRAARDTAFRHADHDELSCTHCHSTRVGHGDLTVTTGAQCLACHHGPIVERECAACHRPAELAGDRYTRTTAIETSVGTLPERPLPFDHGEHAELVCSDCHRGPPALDASRVSCADCHEAHHRPEARCRSCHLEAPEGSHPREVHVTCSGSGCHAPSPVPAAERTREVCLACHQELADHEPGRACASCHLQPPPLAEGGGG